MNTIDKLKKTAKRIGSMGIGDCLSQNTYELWQQDNNFYEREIYIAGDDEGYDKVKKITEEDACELIQNEDFYIENNPARKFLSKMNWLIFKRNIEDFISSQKANYIIKLNKANNRIELQ